MKKLEYDQVGYILVDPFGRQDSGVTSYTKAAAARISKLGLKTLVVTIRQNEDFEIFCRRVAATVSHCSNLICVEVPETLAASRYISENIPLHVRLHFSRSLGAVMQRLPFCPRNLLQEQREVSRAAYISSPSVSGLLAAQTLFKLKDEVSVYPNPIHEIGRTDVSKLPKYDVLFLGRLQNLKGCEDVTALAKARPNLSFIVAAPNSVDWSGKNLPNVTCVDGTKIDKPALYAAAKILILPSIFETSSMVGLEAFASKVPVVTWSHLGLAEYAKEPWVYRARHGNLNDFLEKMDAALKFGKLSSVNSPLENINNNFDSGVLAISLGEKKFLAEMEVLPPYEKKYIQEVLCSSTKISSMEIAKMSTVKRKYRKLIRDPKQFFRDMEIIRTIARITRSSATMTPSENLEKKATQVLPQNMPLIEETRSTLVETSVANRRPKQQLTNIQHVGKIEIKEPPEKPAGLVTGLLYSKDIDMELIEDLLTSLDSFPDFPYVSREKLHVGTFDVNDADDTLAFLNRIDLANKKRLAKLPNLILIDPPTSLYRALRSSTTSQRTIVVCTDLANRSVLDPWCTDVLITVGNISGIELKDFRRKLNIQSIASLPLALRRVLQEGFPRSPDMLVPIFNCRNLQRDRFLKFDSKIYQGIIELECSAMPSATCLDEFCNVLATQVKSMAVLESVYMKYRSLCEEIDGGISPAQLIKYCLYDGLLLNVETA